MTENIFYWMSALGWRPGCFASYQSVIGFLNFCEVNQVVGKKVHFEQGLYFDSTVGNNWWEYYFEPILNGSVENARIEYVSDTEKSAWCTEAISTMTRERACELINRYIKLKSFLQIKIDQFIRNNFVGYMIGVHGRFTDKWDEAPRVPYENFAEEIRSRNIQQPFKIFVATDELSFINYMKQQFGNQVCYIDAIRSRNREPIHHRKGASMSNPYKLGEDAVLDCYLLSRSDILIRTQSNLSSSAANINPKLPVVDLNKAHYRIGLR